MTNGMGPRGGDMHTKQQVFHYWLTFKNSAQYLKMMEAQLLERQRARRLQAATQLWRANTAQSRLKQQAEAVPATPITAAATSEAADAKRTHQTISPPSQRRRSTGAASGLARRGAASYHHRTRVLPDSPESSFLQAGASVAMQSGTYRQLVTVLMYWKRFTRHHSWRRLRLQASLRFSMWIRMHACFKCIRAYAENRSFSRRARTRVIARMRMHHTAAAFTSWGSMVTQRRQVRSFHLECARRIYNRALHRVSAGAFETWLLYMEWESRAAKIVVGRFQGQQRRCFMAWADDSRQQKLMRNALTLVVFHRAQRLLTLTFNALAHTCRRRARVRRLQRKGLLRMQHMLLARCCNSWSEHTLERSRFRLTLLRTILASWRKLAEGDLVFKAKLRSSIWRWKFYNKLSTFRRWRTFTMHVVHVQLHALALLGKLGKRTLHNCFHSWYGTLAARAIKNSKVLVVVRLMQDNSVLAVFNSWHGALLAAIRRQQLFCRCMATMQHRSLVSALRRWQELVVERTRMLNLLRGAVFQLQKGRLCSALALWHFCVKERIRLRYAGTKVVLRLGQRALASAFDSWLDHMLNRLRATASVGRVIVRMQQLVLSSALDSWIAWTEHRSHEKDLMAKAVNRTLHITSARSFSTWAEWTTDRIRGRRLLEHAIRRMCRVRLNHAMLGWADRVVRGHEARDQLLVVLVKMQKNSEARAFRTWLKCHSEVQHVMQRGSVALRKMMLHRSHRAFQSVRQHADDSMRRTRLLTKVVRRVGSLQLARVLDAWVGFTNERRFLMSVALKLQNGILARAFVRFLGVCLRQLQIQEGLMMLAVDRTDRRLLKMFTHWLREVRIRNRQLEATLLVARRLGLRATVKCTFGGWQEALHLAIRLTRRAQKAITFMVQLRYAFVLREWRRASVEAKRRHRLVLRSVIRLYRAAQLKHFKAWASAANTVGKRERLLDGLFGLMAAQSDVMLRARTLMWWKMWTERAEVERKRLGLAMRQLNRTRIIEAYKRWLWFVDIQWDRRRMVEGNMQNMALEFAIQSR